MLIGFGVGPRVAGMLIGFFGDPTGFGTRLFGLRRADHPPVVTARQLPAQPCAALRGEHQIGYRHWPGCGHYERKLREGHHQREAIRALTRREVV
jgi:hypothetical protein